MEMPADVQGGPIGIHGLDDAVEDGERREEPQTTRHPARCPGGRTTAGNRLPRQRPGGAGAGEPQDEHCDQDRQSPPVAERDEERDQERGQHRPQPEQGVEPEHGGVGAGGQELDGEGIEDRYRPAEGRPNAGRRREQDAVSQPMLAQRRHAEDQQGHGQEVGAQTQEIDALGPDATRQRPVA